MRKAAPRGPEASLSAWERALLDSLKTLRTLLAARTHAPAYTVFSDASLIDMVKKRPTTLDTFLDVSGVGQAKQQKYGRVFLKVIRDGMEPNEALAQEMDDGPGRLWTDEEEETLRGWIDEKAGDPMYRYGRQQLVARYDPTALEEDLGDDHLKAGDYGIANLKYILSRMEEWIPDAEDPDMKHRTALYEAIAGQFARYVNAAMLNVGGIRLTDVNSNTAGGPQAIAIPKEEQRASLRWVLEQMKHSEWLEQPSLTGKMPLHVDYSFILRFNFCRAFFNSYKNVILSSHIAQNPYTPQEYMDDLYRIVWESAIKGRPATPAERLIQRMFVDTATDVGGIAEAYAPSVDEIALMGLDDTGLVERYLAPLREIEEANGKGYVASQLWKDEMLSDGYGWQYNVNLRSIDESRALFYHVNDRILKLLRSRVNGATGDTKAHYQSLIYVIERSLYSSQN